jgi:hypothetical protein
MPADERRTIERAAGAPWAHRSYAQRFRHRGGARVPAGARERADREEVVPVTQGSLF